LAEKGNRGYTLSQPTGDGPPDATIEMESYLTAHISTTAIEHNLRLLRECIPPATKLCAVVKADCYGHGLANLLGLLSEHADWLAVTNPEEALALRELGYERPLLMFFSACAHAGGNEFRDALAELIAHNVTGGIDLRDAHGFLDGHIAALDRRVDDLIRTL